MGAGTSAATFFRSLGGSLGVAVLGAVMTNQLAAELKPRVVAAVAALPPAAQGKVAHLMAGGISINDPASIRALPAPVRMAIESGFVAALHPVFLVSAGVSMIAVLLCLALPDRELKGAGHPPAPQAAEEEPDAEPAEDVAADAEAKAATLI